jgi:pimeloyl-ACP methyl ester carboxylesterase
MDALKIDKAIVVGFDWGRRTANIPTFLWPERCKALVSVSGYVVGSQKRRRAAAAAKRVDPMVVSVLFRHRPRRGWVCEVHQGFQPADLAAGLTEMGIRRQNLRTFCKGF